MLNVRNNWCSVLVFIGLFSHLSAQDDAVLATPTFEIVLLPEDDMGYINERLQMKERMSLDDAINTIIELEHFYTLLKNHEKKTHRPSFMVDSAWHHHILFTEMYGNFSRKFFGMDILTHLPFWSGNIHELVDAEKQNPGQNGPRATYRLLVKLFGKENVNETVWSAGRPGDEMPVFIENTEL